MNLTPNQALQQPGYLRILIPLALLFGLALRLFEAAPSYLNPDEAMHFCRSQSADWYEISNLKGTAPPFFFFVVHYVQLISNSELFLRLPFLLSGCLFPWIIYKWLQGLHLHTAAVFAFLILEFSPNLIVLTSQVRGYALALLFTSLAIYFLERALDHRSVPSLLLSSAFLYLGILTEFSVAFATGALGVYALLRLIPQARPIAFKLSSFELVWVGSQVGALACYLFLYQSMMMNLLSRRIVTNPIEGYLRGGFPRPDENLILFFAANTAKQFAYLASSIPMGLLFGAFFIAGLVSLFFVQPGSTQRNRRALAVAVLFAFLFAFCATFAHLFPFGRTRHSILLSLLTVPLIGIGLQRLLQSFPRFALAIPILLTVVLFPLAGHDGQNIPRSRHQLSNMLLAIRQLLASVPSGSSILMDNESSWTMQYYLNKNHCPVVQYGPDDSRLVEILPYRVASFRWSHQSLDQISRDTIKMRQTMQLRAEHPIYVLDSGFDLLSTPIPNSQLLNNVLLLISPEVSVPQLRP